MLRLLLKYCGTKYRKEGKKPQERGTFRVREEKYADERGLPVAGRGKGGREEEGAHRGWRIGGNGNRKRGGGRVGYTSFERRVLIF